MHKHAHHGPFTKNVLGLNRKQALVLCIFITLAVMTVELVYSYLANSLMLFSDGLHMLSHSSSLLISFIAILLAERLKNTKVELGAALINGIGLLVFTIYILWESWERFQEPEHIKAADTLLVALIGLATNLLTAWILGSSGADDLNTRSAFLHMLADTISSIAIIIGAVIILFTDWYLIDALLSAIVALIVGKWSVGLLKNSYLGLREKKSEENQRNQAEQN